MDLEKLEKEGTPKGDYNVEIVEEIDLSDANQVPVLRASDAMELSDLVMGRAKENRNMLADEDNLYWYGRMKRSQVGSTRREAWSDLGATLDHISTCVTNHRYAGKDDELWFEISVSDKVIEVVCVVEKSN